ncbi:sodium:alanine symporter family protein [Clostridium botulinum]|uniref:Sodium:alanine symporter family protein n=1 Tax=Clostridium botulinum TaxID=1491 RepID=A0A0L9Y9D0_CLOBO|nr:MULTISPECIES: sodium:alanine symporter family protein [Clostridium]ACD53504.1 sodium:alanine symporter family protein [Clostridium botulinum E3 str. Alaska E43]EES50555.1 sodium:alanine symporter family protein [Clostridium botulinum E1 str. 'BoNT E Beluga']KAI3350403.1 sodium:alanine symporter family protein [Clostridium botulinum]KOM88422.1 sodium:alanine symporter [Clostridium botulinum]KOR55081.1 sodium:alanine symporter [Clostridium botulinum]
MLLSNILLSTAGVQNFLEKIDSIIWGPPLLILLVGTGLYLTFRLKVLQVFKLPMALKFVFGKDEEAKDEDAQGDVSSFAALCTALSATIGTGNIVGVATAIKAGGPGALLWMWLAAFFGMATKYAEGLLAIKYREVDENGEMCGGPMYYIQNGLGLKWLAKLFAVFGVGVAFFGIGTFGQVNSIAAAAANFNIPLIVTAIVVTVLVALVTLGGIKRISKVSETLVPFMAAAYIVGAVLVLVFNYTAVPSAIKLIFESAFNTEAIGGGVLGITVTMAIRNGIARGVFSNESGLGSAPIAAAAAKTNSPAKQGLISMTGTFFDTIIVCTMTGLAIVITSGSTGVFEVGATIEGAGLTSAAFEIGLPMAMLGKYIVNIGLIFFAFTTILGWNYYGEKCIQYLFGTKSIMPYRIVYIILVAIGPFLPLELIFIIADIVNGCMAFPNLIALIGLRKVVIKETEEFFEEIKAKDSIEEVIA